MLPFAAAHRLRLVLVNRRGYPGTTPLSESDLDAIASSDSTTRAGYFEQRALELGEFMAWFVQKEKIPTYTISQDNKPEGGIVLLGWSSGTTSTIGLLALQDKVPAGIQAALEPYFRSLCIFGNTTLLMLRCSKRTYSHDMAQIPHDGHLASRILPGSTIPCVIRP